MNWTQVLAIVLPVMFAIVIGLFYNNRRLDDLRTDTNKRFDDVNKRFDDVNKRFDDLRLDINTRFNAMNEDVKELKTDVREIRNLLIELLKKESVG